MCPSFTRGTCSIHYQPDLPLEYAPCGATPNGHVLCKAHVFSGLATCVASMLPIGALSWLLGMQCTPAASSQFPFLHRPGWFLRIFFPRPSPAVVIYCFPLHDGHSPFMCSQQLHHILSNLLPYSAVRGL